jgi:hypothetical protein
MPSGHPVIGLLGWVALALGSALLRGEPQRRIGAAGLISLGLALAARQGGVGEAVGSGFLVVNGGLLLLGLWLALGAAVAEGPGPTRLAARSIVLIGAGLVAWRNAEQLLLAGLIRAAAAAVGLGLAAVVVALLGRAIGATRPVRSIGRRLFGAPLRPVLADDALKPTAVMAAAIGTAAVGPHVAAVFLGIVVAAWSGYLAFHSAAARPAPVAPVLVLVLVPAYWLLAAIAGPMGLRTAELASVPMSPAAESLIAAVLLLAGWSVAALWPLHRQLPGAIVGSAGALLLVRVAFPLAPGGLDQWRPLLVPVLVVGMWHAAAHGRWPLLAVGGALLGLAAPSGAGIAGACWLLGTALVMEVTGMMSLPSRAMGSVHAAAWITGAWGGLLALEGSLRGEVVYTALGAVGIGLLIAGLVRHPERSEGSAGP